MSLPNFLVIGAQRAGTSLLHTILQAHREVYVPTERKEIHFFDRYFHRGLPWYQGYFPAADKASAYRAVGEATPDYLASPEAPARIRALIPDCRLIAILRNPVDRAYSWYHYARRSRNERRDFDSFLQADPTVLTAGLYALHLERYFALFPREAFLVLLYEELVEDPARELERLARFLLLSRDDPLGPLDRKVNPSEAPRFRAGYAAARHAGSLLMRHDFNWPVRIAKWLGVRKLFGRAGPAPPMSVTTRTRLVQFYSPDVARLGDLLQRDFAAWRLDQDPTEVAFKKPIVHRPPHQHLAQEAVLGTGHRK